MAELVWEGKYDDKGQKVGPVRLALPFQTVETVNETTTSRQHTQSLFDSGEPSEWRNRLIWGDKKYVLPALMPELAGKVDLIYIDPPFNTGSDFSFTAMIPEEDDGSGINFVKDASAIERRAYADTWGKGLNSYLQWFYETVVVARDLLSSTGSLYVHLDDTVSHYAKVVLDEVFGINLVRNEIIWQRTNAHNMVGRHWDRVHDVLFFATKTDRYTWNKQFGEFGDAQLKEYRPDKDGRLFTGQDLTVSSKSKGRQFTWRGVTPPPNRAWAFSEEKLEELLSVDKIIIGRDGKPIQRGLKVYLDEKAGARITTLWNDVGRVGNTSGERLNYNTQKPEALLSRIIKTSSNEGDLVLDCFSGSGTTAATAEKLGRRWIAADLGRFAIHTTRKRLLGIPGVKPFDVLNLGRYERQAWQEQRFGSSAGDRQAAYRAFILKLYGAQPLHELTYLHGMKNGRAVHVGSVDSPVSAEDVAGMTREFRQLVGSGENAPTRSGIDVLGWDFAFEMNETAEQKARLADIDLQNKIIPREVMERRAKEDPEGIVFYEAAAVSFDLRAEGRTATLTLTDFLMPLDGVPQSVIDGISSWVQWIDYWAVDWDSSAGGAFHNMDQAYRTKREPKLKRTLEHTYAEPGEYVVTVKVVDQLGNDTTKTRTLVVG